MIKLIDRFELNTIVEMEELYFFGTDRYTGPMITKMFRDNKYRFYKFTSENNEQDILGYVIVLLNYDFIELEKICVRRDQWRLGIGKQLLNHVYEAHEGVILTEVRKSNTNAIALYESFGMELINQRTNYYSDGETALIYKKTRGFSL